MHLGVGGHFQLQWLGNARADQAHERFGMANLRLGADAGRYIAAQYDQTIDASTLVGVDELQHPLFAVAAPG